MKSPITPGTVYPRAKGWAYSVVDATGEEIIIGRSLRSAVETKAMMREYVEAVNAHDWWLSVYP